MLMPFSEIPIKEEKQVFDLLTATEFSHRLVVWNDNVNTFDWVIET